MGKCSRVRFLVFSSFAVIAFGIAIGTSNGQTEDLCATGTVCVMTWQQDTNLPAGSMCSGCSYRTGENLSEATVTSTNVQNSNFGQLCSVGRRAGFRPAAGGDGCSASGGERRTLQCGLRGYAKGHTLRH